MLEEGVIRHHGLRLLRLILLLLLLHPSELSLRRNTCRVGRLKLHPLFNCMNHATETHSNLLGAKLLFSFRFQPHFLFTFNGLNYVFYRFTDCIMRTTILVFHFHSSFDYLDHIVDAMSGILPLLFTLYFPSFLFLNCGKTLQLLLSLDTQALILLFFE